MATQVASKVQSQNTANYLRAREGLCQQFLKDGNPSTLIRGLSDAMDLLVTECVEGANLNQVVVIATGGYGRRELFPYSDVDVLFLTQEDPASLKSLVERVLYPLWDLKLQVGHAVHDVAGVVAAAKKDVATATALLDARLVVGNQALFDALKARLQSEWMGVHEELFVEAKLEEREIRHKKFGDSRYLLEPNIKESKGGLRDLHTLEWLAKYAYRVHDVRDLVAKQILSAEEADIFDRARRFLWNMRAHMHILAGKAEERLTFDMQHKLTHVLGFTHPEPHKAVERMMKRYFTNARIVGSLTRIVCAILEEEHKRKPKHPVARIFSGRWKLSGFILEGERLSVRREDEFESHPTRMLEMFFVAGMNGLDVHPRALQQVARSLKFMDKAYLQKFDPCHMFLRILLEVPEVETTLKRMNDVGLLARFIPAFGRIVGQTQFNMYHVYTVDEHTIVGIGNLRALESGKWKKDFPHATEVANQISQRHVLYLALVCHDLAKGKEGDHSEIGEDIGRKIALRFGFSTEDSETVAWLVRYHLLMSATAFKRDLNDPKTVQDFVGLVQSASRLRLLFVLTVADICAVGPTVWNEWKGELLSDLYTRAERYIRTGRIESQTQDVKALIGHLQSALPAYRHEIIENYIEQSHDGYLADIKPKVHAEILGMLEKIRAEGVAFTTRLSHIDATDLSELIICTADRYGLFAKLTGALSLAGANIISAKVFTRKDGIVVDMFQIQGLDRKAFDAPEKQARLQAKLEHVLGGEVDIAKELSKLKASYPSRKDALAKRADVHIDNAASNVFSVLEITSMDRVGLLYDITQKLADLQLSISSAHISTYGEQAVDVFYVKDLFGMKIVHWTKMRAVREALLTIL